MSKAASKFIVYDLPEKSKMALVTFSNDSAVAQSMTVLTDERSRGQLADRIPNKYKVKIRGEKAAPFWTQVSFDLLPQVKLSSDQRCVVCGVQVALHSVLGDEKAGAHVIIVTRGDNR